MIQISIRHLIYLVLAIVVAAVILMTMSYAVITIANANIDTSRVLIPAMGSIAGGIIGGIVAVIIAAYNASRALKNEKTKQMHTSLTMLKLIRQEILDNISVLESAIPSSNEYNIIKAQLSDDTWKSTMINLLVSDELLAD